MKGDFDIRNGIVVCSWVVLTGENNYHCREWVGRAVIIFSVALLKLFGQNCRDGIRESNVVEVLLSSPSSKKVKEPKSG